MYRILNPARMITGVIDDSVAVLGVISIILSNGIRSTFNIVFIGLKPRIRASVSLYAMTDIFAPVDSR